MPPITSPLYEETVVPASEGVSLWMRKVQMPEAEVRAEVVFTHGLGEHSRRYEHVAAALAGCGVRAWKYDLRGHGRSGGRRGDAPRYDLFVEDLGRIVGLASGSGRPLFLLGHSFGGQITIRYLEQRQAEVQGAVICSPWLKLAFQPAWWRLALARLALWVCPSVAHTTPATPALLSRDMEYLLSLPDLHLTHRRLSPRLYFAILKAAQKALKEAESLRVPLLFIHGGDDRVTCAWATREVYERAASKDKTLSLYPDARHETHNDLCRNRVLAEICAWISERVSR